jgi:uncharacterized Fe-S cluster-containing radical SAM superfamily protein
VFYVTGSDPSLGADLELWCRLTRNALVATAVDDGVSRWTIRCGELPAEFDADRPVGSRLWLYSNFDCNLSCDYCCVRSSPKAPRRDLGLVRVQQIAAEAAAAGVGEIYITGGEPFMLPDIDGIVEACHAAAPTAVLTNGMLFSGRRMETLRRIAALGVTLQISLDSPTPDRHDAHRGARSWSRAWTGVKAARSLGVRVRVAATVSTDAEEREFGEFLDQEHFASEDRVVRRIVLRGLAETGVPLARADLVPEVTITTDGVYWHPVGAEDDDFFVTRNIFPLADAFAAVRDAFARERQHATRLARIFNCA